MTDKKRSNIAPADEPKRSELVGQAPTSDVEPSRYPIEVDPEVDPETARIPADQRGNDPDHPALQPADVPVKPIDGVEHDGEANKARFDADAPKDAKVRAADRQKELDEQFG